MDQKLVMAIVLFHLSSLSQASQVPLMEGGNCGQMGGPAASKHRLRWGWAGLVLIPMWGVG